MRSDILLQAGISSASQSLKSYFYSFKIIGEVENFFMLLMILFCFVLVFWWFFFFGQTAQHAGS